MEDYPTPPELSYEQTIIYDTPTNDSDVDTDAQDEYNEFPFIYCEIENDPLIPVHKRLICEQCPRYFSKVHCL